MTTEVRRKFLHMLPGVLPFVFASIPHRDPLSSTALTIVIVSAGALTLLVLASRRSITRADDPGWFSRVLSYPAVVIVALLLFPAHPEYAAVVVVVLAFGDGAASLGGMTLPRWALPWNPEKSWGGLLSFVLCAAPLAIVAYWREAQPAVAFAEAAVCGITATLAGAAAESLRAQTNDNLRVGVAALMGVVLGHAAFGRA